jgi:uncharacterized tellurite resistance protein B-like protein
LALDPVKQWTLLCGGLVAHADGVLDGTECERLMAVLEAAEGIDGDEYSAWMAAIADAGRLEELLAALPPPPAERHRELLEGAWVMAVVDGRRSPEEARMIERLAERMGVEPVQLDYWREAWTSAEQEFARAVTAVIGWVLGGGAPALEADRAAISDALWQTPIEQGLRDELLARAMAPCSRDDAGKQLGTLTRARRIAVVHRAVEPCRLATRPAESRARFNELAWETSIPGDRIERWFHG